MILHHILYLSKELLIHQPLPFTIMSTSTPSSNDTSTSPFPQEWITAKTIKTISGSALCCWLITLFFDLVCFTPIKNLQLHTLLVLLVSIAGCVGLAVNKVFSYKSPDKKALWLLVIPNAMLIYIHALGFQVATKELAIRANPSNTEKAEQHAALFDFLTRQTSWIPSKELEIKTREFEIRKDTLQQLNRALTDSISQLRGRLGVTPPLNENKSETENLLNRLKTMSDSSSYYNSHYRKCAASNAMLKDSIAALNEYLKRAFSPSNIEKGLSEKHAVLLRRIEDKNALINKWNQTMLGLKLPSGDMERVMNGYMGDEQYYRKLFRPIPTNVQ